MKQVSVSVVFLMFVVVFFGCGSTASFSDLNAGISAGPAKSAADVKVYVAKDIGSHYTELGSVSCSLHGELDGTKYIARIKEEAAKIGADAVVGYVQYGNGASGIAVKFN